LSIVVAVEVVGAVKRGTEGTERWTEDDKEEVGVEGSFGKGGKAFLVGVNGTGVCEEDDFGD
jgi:hypothetical protein